MERPNYRIKQNEIKNLVAEVIGVASLKKNSPELDERTFGKLLCGYHVCDGHGGKGMCRCDTEYIGDEGGCRCAYVCNSDVCSKDKSDYRCECDKECGCDQDSPPSSCNCEGHCERFCRCVSK